jgi:ribosome-associated protein
LASTLTSDDDRVAQRLTSAGFTPSSLAAVAAAAASAKKGNDVVILRVGDIVSIIDEFVIVSASNTRQVLTIVDEIERALREQAGVKPLGSEGRDDASWVLLDYGDIVVHVFLDETRAFYDLERLWADAPRTEWVEAATAAGDR